MPPDVFSGNSSINTVQQESSSPGLLIGVSVGATLIVSIAIIGSVWYFLKKRKNPDDLDDDDGEEEEGTERSNKK